MAKSSLKASDLPITLIAQMPRGGHCCSALEFSPDGTQLAACAGDRKVHFYDVPAGKRRHHAKEHTGDADSLCFSPDSQWLASAGTSKVNQRTAGGEVLLWSVANATLVKRIPLTAGNDELEVGPVLFSPSGKHLACMVEDDENSKAYIAVIDPHAGKIVRKIPLPRPGSTLAFAPDGKTLAGLIDKELILWQFPSGKQIKTIPRAGRTSALCWSPDGKTIAVAEADGSVTLLAAESGKAGATLKESKQHTVDKVQFSADGRQLATIGVTMHGDSVAEVLVWDLKTRKVALGFPGNTGVEYPQGFPGQCAFSPDFSLFANAGAMTRLWQCKVQ